MKDRTLTLSRENWWLELDGAEDIPQDARRYLLSAVDARLTETLSPDISEKDFAALIKEVGTVKIDDKEFFVVRMQCDGFFRLRLAAEKSPHWDEYYDKRGPFRSRDGEFNEGFPQFGMNAWCEIITWEGDHLLAHVDYSQQYEADGLSWLARGGRTYNKQNVVAWYRL